MFKHGLQFPILLGALCLCGGVLIAWDLVSPPEAVYGSRFPVPFRHDLHGENIGTDCGKCHPGASFGIRAGMPSRSDCLDCHNLPLSTSPAGAALDSVLPGAMENPFSFTSLLPSHVVFPHGVHAKAGVSCETCHGSAQAIDRGQRPKIQMQECLACHRGERGFPSSATDCARCHR